MFRLFFILLSLFSSLNVFSAQIKLSDLSQEEKVGQLLMVFFKGEELNDDAKRLIQEANVGSFIYYNWANGLQTPEQVQALSNGLQRFARSQKHGIPLLIAIDQEGGRVTRLKQTFTEFPSQGILGKLPPYYTMRTASFISQELKAVGINMNLAPVVDINSNPARTVLGMRSFGSSPKLVARHAQYALNGYRKENVIAVLKHFPGYGEASIDPHLGLPVVDKTKENLEREELFPFKFLSHKADAIMTAHIVMNALDPKQCTTLSRTIVEGLLRKRLGFEGVIISDSLVMEGLLTACESIEEAAIRAFEAGHDILLFGGKMLAQKNNKDLTVDDILKIYHSLLSAVQNGRISQERLDASVARIIKLKEKYALFSFDYPGDKEIHEFIKSGTHQQFVDKIKGLTPSDSAF